jgi:hypothetical protein
MRYVDSSYAYPTHLDRDSAYHILYSGIGTALLNGIPLPLYKDIRYNTERYNKLKEAYQASQI